MSGYPASRKELARLAVELHDEANRDDGLIRFNPIAKAATLDEESWRTLRSMLGKDILRFLDEQIPQRAAS